MLRTGPGLDCAWAASCALSAPAITMPASRRVIFGVDSEGCLALVSILPAILLREDGARLCERRVPAFFPVREAGFRESRARRGSPLQHAKLREAIVAASGEITEGFP